MEILDFLASYSASWRFWLASFAGLAIGYLIQGGIAGLWPAMLTVCGALIGIIWTSVAGKSN